MKFTKATLARKVLTLEQFMSADVAWVSIRNSHALRNQQGFIAACQYPCPCGQREFGFLRGTRYFIDRIGEWKPQ